MEYGYRFQKKFAHFVWQEGLLQKGERVVVAVSGGVDSVVLLHCLLKLSADMNLKLFVAHFNHGLRGVEADRDELFAKNLAESYGLPFYSEKGDVRGYAEDKGVGIEEAARELRYQFLEKVRRKVHADKIATGHHADDQAETVLYRLFRGTGWHGLRGIPVRRGAIIRPLLFAYRTEIERYAKEVGLEFRLDVSNLSYDYRRNIIRHKIMPLIKSDINRQAPKHLNELVEIFREGDAYLNHEAQKAYSNCVKQEKSNEIILEIEQFSGYFTIIQTYVLLHAFARLGLPQDVLTFKKINAAIRLIQRKRVGKYFPVYRNWQLGLDHSGIVIFRSEESRPVRYQLRIGEEVEIPERGVIIRAERVSCREVKFSDDPFVEFVDGALLKDEKLTVRSIAPGDWFVPLGLKHRQKLSDFFIDHKVPLRERRNALVLACGEQIIWVIGYRLDERFRITEKTKNCVKLRAIYEQRDQISKLKT